MKEKTTQKESDLKLDEEYLPKNNCKWVNNFTHSRLYTQNKAHGVIIKTKSLILGLL